MLNQKIKVPWNKKHKKSVLKTEKLIAESDKLIAESDKLYIEPDIPYIWSCLSLIKFR